jgi:hypothetical protein
MELVNRPRSIALSGKYAIHAMQLPELQPSFKLPVPGKEAANWRRIGGVFARVTCKSRPAASKPDEPANQWPIIEQLATGL